MNNKYLEKVIMENNDEFTCLLIKNEYSISHLSWTDHDYLDKLCNSNYYNIISTNSDNFIEKITNNLNIKLYDIPNLVVKNEIVAEYSDYVYELMYIDLLNNPIYIDQIKKSNINPQLNDIATLLCITGEKIYSYAILFKTYIKQNNSDTDSMYLVNVNVNDIKNILYDRVNTSIVTWDWENNWNEKKISGDLKIFTDDFFEKCDFKKIELAFLMHNINIWYIENEFGENNICGKLLNKPIEKCIIFSMKTDDKRTNISLDEVTKIIKLSNECTNIPTH